VNFGQSRSPTSWSYSRVRVYPFARLTVSSFQPMAPQDALLKRLCIKPETLTRAQALLHIAKARTGTGSGHDLGNGVTGLPAICAHLASLQSESFLVILRAELWYNQSDHGLRAGYAMKTFPSKWHRNHPVSPPRYSKALSPRSDPSLTTPNCQVAVIKSPGTCRTARL
jgi:hypothetical protein